jgi:hypothetical protein
MFNATMLVLGSSRVQADRIMLEQLDSLVQPTQFLEFLRKTMPMNNAQLDMISAIHEAMFRRLNALDVLFRGGQLAVDAFTTSGLTGVKKRKAAAIASAKKAEPNQPSGKRARQGRGGGGGGGYARQSSKGGGNSSRQLSGGRGRSPGTIAFPAEAEGSMRKVQEVWSCDGEFSSRCVTCMWSEEGVQIGIFS